MLKKLSVLLTSVTLLAIFLFNCGGYWIYFDIQQTEVKKEIKKKIKRHISAKDIVVIIITPKDSEQPIWIEKNEFYFNGDLFDVVKAEKVKNGTVKYYCINDSKEKKLRFALREQIQNHSYPGTTPVKSTKKVHSGFAKKYVHQQKNIALINTTITGNIFYAFDSFHRKNTEYSPPTPPPELG